MKKTEVKKIRKLGIPQMKYLLALLATARIANVPSVVSNVMFGAVVAGSLWQTDLGSAFLAAFAACLLYVGGNFFNDWHDAEWDRENRPERGIPSGIFGRGTYLFFALGMMLAAVSIGFIGGVLLGASFLLIVLLVVVYTIIHKKSILGVWVMGTCRAMLYVVGFFSIHRELQSLNLSWLRPWDLQAMLDFIVVFIAPIVGMICYIAGISLLAKRESKLQHEDVSLLVPRLLVFMPIVTHGLCFAWLLGSMDRTVHILFHALVLFGGWTYWAVMKERPIGQRVSRLLMGIPLIDGICMFVPITLLIHHPTVVFRPFMLIFSIPILAFLLAGILQKIAPAS